MENFIFLKIQFMLPMYIISGIPTGAVHRMLYIEAKSYMKTAGLTINAIVNKLISAGFNSRKEGDHMPVARIDIITQDKV